MNKWLGVLLACGLGGSSIGCSGDAEVSPVAKLDGSADARADVAVDGADVAVDAGSTRLIFDYPVLDPNGTYGGKTYAGWAAEWIKWIVEYPGPESLLFNTPGAYCEMGQSMVMGNGTQDAPPFYLGLGEWTVGGTVTQRCTVPMGRTVFFTVLANWDPNIAGCIAGASEQYCRDDQQFMSTATTFELTIDGKSYGSRLADFAAYLVDCIHFSAAIPNTPDDPWVSYYGCKSTQPVLQADEFASGYWIMLAPLSPGKHTIHTKTQVPPSFNWDVTYDLNVADTTSLATADGGPPADATPSDAAQAVNFCTGPASAALIDDMSGTSISLQPPACGSAGNWTVRSPAPAVLTTPAGDPSVLSNCGSLCQSLYSPLPAGFPGTSALLDAGAVDSGVVDGGTSGEQAMCVAGQTGGSQYSWSGMALTFAYSGAPPNSGGPKQLCTPSLLCTTDPPPALIDASQYSGIEFWLWASPDTASAMSAGFSVQLVDRNQLPGGGVCNPNATSGKKPCSVAGAGISFSAAAASQALGPLLGKDDGELTALAPGWQLVRAPWSSFVSNPYYGGGNEASVDPTTLAFAQFVVEQESTSGAAIPFDFCVYDLRFYK